MEMDSELKEDRHYSNYPPHIKLDPFKDSILKLARNVAYVWDHNSRTSIPLKSATHGTIEPLPMTHLNNLAYSFDCYAAAHLIENRPLPRTADLPVTKRQSPVQDSDVQETPAQDKDESQNVETKEDPEVKSADKTPES